MIIPKSSKATAKKTTTTASAKPAAFVPRVIPIEAGDVFGQGVADFWDVIVVGAGDLKCEVRRIDDGRASSIQTARLHREYSRRGEIETKRAHKKLAAIVAREAKGGK